MRPTCLYTGWRSYSRSAATFSFRANTFFRLMRLSNATFSVAGNVGGCCGGAVVCIVVVVVVVLAVAEAAATVVVVVFVAAAAATVVGFVSESSNCK